MCHSCLKLGSLLNNLILYCVLIFESKMALNESTATQQLAILAPVKVTVERLRCMILSNDTKHAYLIIILMIQMHKIKYFFS